MANFWKIFDRLRLRSLTSDPSDLSNGEVWYNSTSNKFKYRENGATVDLTSALSTSSEEISNLGISCSVGSNALTIALKQSDGSTDATVGSPVKIGFGSSTATSGAYNQRSVTSSLSVIISSGSTLGHASGQDHYIYVYALDNAGTVELAVSSVYYDPGTIVSTTTEGGAGAADSNRLIYSTTSRSNVRIRPIARLKSNQTTAGTWTSVPSEVSLLPFDVQLIHARYTSNSGQTIPDATETRVNFEDRYKDTHNAVTTGASWVFTAPKSTIYTIMSQASFTTTTGWDENEVGYGALYINGTVQRYHSYIIQYSSTTMTRQATVFGLEEIYIEAGQTVAFEVFQNTGGPQVLNNVSAYNVISITEKR